MLIFELALEAEELDGGVVDVGAIEDIAVEEPLP